MLHGSINHVSITVSDLSEAMKFFGPLLEFLGYTVGKIFHDDRTNHDLTVNINYAPHMRSVGDFTGAVGVSGHG